MKMSLSALVISFFGAVVFCGAVVHVSAAATPVDSAPNVAGLMVANAGFEELRGETSFPRDWGFTSLPEKAHLVRYESVADASSASRCLLIAIARDHPERVVAYNALQDVPGFVAGKTYRVSAMVRTEGLRSRPFVCAQCLDASKTKFVGFAVTPKTALDADIDDWERIETTITVPEGTATFRVRVGISSEGNAGGSALIDDIQVVEAP